MLRLEGSNVDLTRRPERHGMSIIRGAALSIAFACNLVYLTIDRRRHDEFLCYGVVALVVATQVP